MSTTTAAPARDTGTGRPFVGCVFIGTSVDGFIARSDGTFDWLTGESHDPPVDPGDTGYDGFMDTIDVVLLGRGTYEVVAAFDEWPYGERPVHVVGSQLDTTDDRVRTHRSLAEAVAAIEAGGTRRVYVDGGTLIRSCLAADLIRELIITRAPILLGTGIPLFGPVGGDIPLQHVGTRELGAGYVQSEYRVP